MATLRPNTFAMTPPGNCRSDTPHRYACDTDSGGRHYDAECSSPSGIVPEPARASSDEERIRDCSLQSCWRRAGSPAATRANQRLPTLPVPWLLTNIDSKLGMEAADWGGLFEAYFRTEDAVHARDSVLHKTDLLACTSNKNVRCSVDAMTQADARHECCASFSSLLRWQATCCLARLLVTTTFKRVRAVAEKTVFHLLQRFRQASSTQVCFHPAEQTFLQRR